MSSQEISMTSEKRKASMGAMKTTPANRAFNQLPDEIIEHILQLASPNAFASLVIINRKWRTVSQQAHLYARHLSRCSSCSAYHQAIPAADADDDRSLPRLKKLFAQEIKRNLFEAYLRPHETIISLVSTSISSSSAPGGEAFHFSISPKGHLILAYSCSRIHVIDVKGPEVVVKRELKILRRPASTTITDDGSLLAVLSTDLQVDLYDLTGKHPKHTHAVALDHSPRTIALSPTGSVLAAAYDAGVEVSSLDPGNSNTERRAVKCYGVDKLAFSADGTQLLGTTLQSRNPSTVILTAPYYNTHTGGTLPEENVSVSALWTTSILFPNGSRDCSHAVLLPSGSDEEASWAFTYDRVLETFRAVRIDDLRNGTTYFTGPVADAKSAAKLLPSTLPTASQRGDLVAAGFQGAIWIYGVPEDLDALPLMSNTVNSNSDSGLSTPPAQLGRRNSAPSLHSVHRHRDTISRTPQWQLLCDRFRNNFVEGRKICTFDQVSAMSWISDNPVSSHGEKLIAVAPGVGGKFAFAESWEEDGMSPIDGGRISILDFNYAINDGKKTMITIEVGANEAEVLEEEHRDLDTEVAIVRRRTVAQRRGDRSHVARAGSIPRSPNDELPPLPPVEDELGDPYAAQLPPSRRPSNLTSNSDEIDDVSLDEAQEAFDAPYSHTNPRSTTTLRRAATAAAVNRRLHPRAVAQDHIEYRRADGREEHPHESDADNWVPPPPPYTKDPLPPLPEHIQRSLLAEAAQLTLQRASNDRTPSVEFLGPDSGGLSRSRTVASTSTARSRRESYPFQRSVSDSTTANVDRVSFDEERPRPRPRPASSPGFSEFDDLYDVSPPGSAPGSPHLSPHPSPQSSYENTISRRPAGALPSINGNTSPASVMIATLQGPVSPIPQPPMPMTNLMDSRLQSQTILHEYRPFPNMDIASRPRKYEDKALPLPPADGELSPLPPALRSSYQVPEISPLSPFGPFESVTPVSPLTSPLSRRFTSITAVSSIRNDEDDDIRPVPISRRSDTEPIPSVRPATATVVKQGSMVAPSAELLARLNSRQNGRPIGLTDPSRRVAGSQVRRSSSAHKPTPSWDSSQRQSQQQRMQAPPIITTEPPVLGPPRAAVGAHGSPISRSRGSSISRGSPVSRVSLNESPIDRPSTSPQQHASLTQRRVSIGRMPPPPTLRAAMPPLETIHSHNTTPGEPTPWFTQYKPSTPGAGMTRQTSRAERSSAKNIKDAKKKGWRQSLSPYAEDKEFKRFRKGSRAQTAPNAKAGASSAGDEEKEKHTKCHVM
ncbi:hypothetical protein HYALB_00004788 [Hymenoscyphus albidus]|uniref:F-box domain-containing protein n=1 Tax=Hymenoscyphus albidus TaxID=595503 RepID=A0A9N9LN03_9HELO|nr:hypothetical protein HYALB_00004788 [Hymenoscyphus albidus]